MGLKRYLDKKNWYSNDVILLLKREPGDFDMPELKKGHSVAAVNMDNLEDTQVFEGEAYIEIYKRFLLHGDYGFFAYKDGRCAARCWGMVHPIDAMEGGKSLGLEEDSIWVHYVETAEPFRRMGLGRDCLSALVNLCKDYTMYVTIHIDNKASLNLHKKYFHFKEVGIIRIKRCFMRSNTTLYRFDKTL